MAILFFALCQLFNLACLVLLVIGLFSPQTALFWFKGERTRGNSISIYFFSMVGSALLCGTVMSAFPPDFMKNVPSAKVDSTAKAVQPVLPAPVENSLVEQKPEGKSEKPIENAIVTQKKASPTPSIRNPNGRTGGCFYHGRELYVGRKGGCYYLSSSGKKEYVKRYYCRNCD